MKRVYPRRPPTGQHARRQTGSRQASPRRGTLPAGARPENGTSTARGVRPPIEATAFGAFEDELETVPFPTTAAAVETVGDGEIDSPDGPYRLADLLADTDSETFDSPAILSAPVQRPTVGGATKRIIEASDDLPDVDFGGSGRDAYQKTVQALAAIDADDEGIDCITVVIGEWIDENGKLPGSRAVSGEVDACRTKGYAVSADAWLGI